MEQNKNISAPPYSNTGAQSRERGTLIACLDWAEGTFSSVSGLHRNPHDVIEVLGLENIEFSKADRGLNGYRKMMVSEDGGMKILYDGNENMGIHFIFSGEGCREYERKIGTGWTRFLGRVLNWKGHFTRIDGAIDDQNDKPYFKPQTIKRKVTDGMCRSKFKHMRGAPQKWSIEDGEELPRNTYYFGERSSRIMVRVYDKWQERQDKGVKLSEDIKSWIRTEVVFREERAQAFAEKIVEGENVGALIAGVLKNYITFLKPKRYDRGKNKGEMVRKKDLPVADFWGNFLEGVEAVKLTKPKEELTLEKKEAWFRKNMKHVVGELTLKKIMEGEGLEHWLNEYMMECVDNLPEGRAEEVTNQVNLFKESKEKAAYEQTQTASK